MAMQEIDHPGYGTGAPAPRTEEQRAPCERGQPLEHAAPAPVDSDPKTASKVSAAMAEGRVSLYVRMVLLAVLPGLVCSLAFDQLARRGAAAPAMMIAAMALAGLSVAYAVFEARRLLRPIRLMIAQSDRLATRYCGQVPGRSRCELMALAKSFDAMTAALLTHANTSRELYAAEAQNTIELQRQYALMQMLRNLASAANNGEPLDTALQSSLREIGTYLDWPVGRLVHVVRKTTGEVESTRSYWYVPDPKQFSVFIDACNAASWEAETTGLIGRAQESHLSHWVCDLGHMQGWSQSQAAAACGLRTGFIVPISAGPQSTAFVEFFTDHRIEASAEMLELVEAISVELWNTANRYQSESALRSPSARTRRLASIAESMDDAVALTADDGRIEWANGGLTRLVGFSATQLIGKNLAEVLFTAGSPSAAECRHQIESGTRVIGLALPTCSDTVDGRWYELQIQPLPDELRATGAVFVVVRDITQQRAAQSALADALASASRESQSRSQLLADVSLGLRAPVNQTLGLADLLLATGLDERQRGLVDSVRRSAETLLSTTSDILDLSKIASGQLTLESQNFDLWALLEDLVGQMAPRAHAKKIELVYERSLNLPTAVRGDSARLRQILAKLIDNAIRFTE
ncbi:MAG TPA: PAS domain-containing protein, partial [Burkholderiaceae bacterium]|nr:PAS domain-containing protein [Burkholderiaceae bacterium]